MSDNATTDAETRDEVEIAYPKNYKVILLNDDFTPMEFVIHILVMIFHMEPNRAVDVMLDVHQNGRGVAGVYSYEIAEQKRLEVVSTARHHQHPLMAEIEEDG